MRSLAIAFVVSSFAAWAGAANPPVPSADSNLLILGDRQAHRLRLRVEVDGRPLEKNWDEALSALFLDLDRDGNGVLSQSEASRAPSALRVRQLAWPAYLFAAPVAVPWDELDAGPADGKVTQEKFVAYYRRHGVGTVQIGVGSAPPATLLTDAILKHLDRDGDGKVSQANWRSADVALHPLDLDDDELIRPHELVARTPYPGTFGGLMLTTQVANKKLPKLLDGFPVLRLPQDPADTSWESQRAGRTKPGLEKIETLTVRLGEHPGASAAVEHMGHGVPRDAAQLAFDDGPRVTLYTVLGHLPMDFESARTLARARFSEADQDGDGFVTRAEPTKPITRRSGTTSRSPTATVTAGSVARNGIPTSTFEVG